MSSRGTPEGGTELGGAERDVARLRRAAAADPARHLPELGYALLRFGSLLAAETDRNEESVRVFGEAAGLYRRLAETERAPHLAGLAVALQRQALGLGLLGRREEARAAAREAVGLWRCLAERGVEGSRAELAGALINLGNQLAETGRHHEALDRVTEAVEIRRSLVDPVEGTGRGELASALGDLGVKLGEMGRQDEALDVLRAAVATYRAMADRGRRTTRSGAGETGTPQGPEERSVGDLLEHAAVAFAAARALTGLGRTAEADPYFAEAAELRAEAGAREPAAVARLDALLADHGYRATGDGRIRRDDASREGGSRESGSHGGGSHGGGSHGGGSHGSGSHAGGSRHREGTHHDRDRLHRFFGRIDRLNTQALALADAGRPDLALAPLDEALTLSREAAAGRATPALVALARTLHNLGLVRAWAGRRAEALEAADEAVHLYRRLLSTVPETVRPLLADAADSLGSRLALLGRHRDAVAPATEAVALHRQLAEADPAAYRGSSPGS